MSDYIEELTRWDATHTRSIRVGYQDEIIIDPVKEDAKYFGLTILTGIESVADVFGVELEKDSSVIDKAVRDAITVGDHVFFIEYGNHSAEWVHILNELPNRTWDSCCAGVLIVHNDAWLSAMPRRTFARKYVKKVLDDAFGERVTATLNGWLYQAVVEDGAVSCYILNNYLSSEEALKDAMLEFPDIKYEKDDFDEEVTFVLKAA